MYYSFFVALLSSSFLVSSLEAKPPKRSVDKDSKIERSSKRACPKVEKVSADSSEPTNPFQPSHLFGLSALKEWDKLDQEGKMQWKEKAQQQVEQAMKQKIGKNLEEAKKIFRTNVLEKSCATSMFWLGKMEEDESNYEKALSWYVGSFCTNLLQGKSFKEIIEPSLNPWKALTSLCDNRLHQAQSVVRELFSLGSFGASSYTCASSRVDPIARALVNAHADYYPDNDLSAYTVELAKWSSSRISLLESLGLMFYCWAPNQPLEKATLHKAGYCGSLFFKYTWQMSESHAEVSVPTLLASSALPSDPLSLQGQAEPAPDQIQPYFHQEEAKESSSASLAILSKSAIQSSVEPVSVEAQVSQISIEERKKLKEFQKKEIAKKRKELLKKFFKGKNLLHEEECLLLKKATIVESMKDIKPKLGVKFDKFAQSQLKSLLRSDVKKVWALIDDIKQGGNQGHPEPLSNVKTPEGGKLFSRRITEKHRLVYTLSKGVLTILSCEGHYDD